MFKDVAFLYLKRLEIGGEVRVVGVDVHGPGPDVEFQPGVVLLDFDLFNILVFLVEQNVFVAGFFIVVALGVADDADFKAGRFIFAVVPVQVHLPPEAEGAASVLATEGTIIVVSLKHVYMKGKLLAKSLVASERKVLFFTFLQSNRRNLICILTGDIRKFLLLSGLPVFSTYVCAFPRHGRTNQRHHKTERRTYMAT